MEPSELARFEAVMLPHMDAAYTLARYLVRDEHEAQDAVQDAYLRALRFFGGYRGGDSRSWLLRIVRNTCYTERRRRAAARHAEEFDEEIHSGLVEDAGDDPEASVLRNATREVLERALLALPPEFREVIVLRELEGLSYREIGQVAGVPEGTVMSRLSRARKRLSRLVGSELEEIR